LLLLKQERRRRQLTATLAEFVKDAWPVIEPSVPLAWGWHLDALCEHLQAVSARRLRGLLVMVPPRSTKSTIASVLWPAWEWASRPQTRFLTASYALSLAIRDALRSRRVLTSPWYRSRWGGVFRMTGDQNAKQRYENDKTGYRLALSVDSGTTGEGGDITLIDDPHNVTEAESEATRLATLRWHDEAFYNRLNDAKSGARVIIGQRVHPGDLIGHVLAQGGFEELRIPEEFEAGRRCVTSLGWSDPRTAEGDLLRPGRFGPKEVADAKQRLGSYGYAAQHQQRPTPREGGLYKSAWFGTFAFVGADGYRVGGRFVRRDACVHFGVVDPAVGKTAASDPVGFGAFACTPDGDLLALHLSSERVALEGIVPRLVRLDRDWRFDFVGCEANGFQVTVAREARSRLDCPVVELGPEGRGKVVRSYPAIIEAEQGRILVPESAGWVEPALYELTSWTGKDGERDEIPDVVSYAVSLRDRYPAGDAWPLALGV
jgi:phage terminase large subunit-like protein